MTGDSKAEGAKLLSKRLSVETARGAGEAGEVHGASSLLRSDAAFIERRM